MFLNNVGCNLNAFNTTEQFSHLKKKPVLSQFKSSSSISESLSATNGFAVSTVVPFPECHTLSLVIIILYSLVLPFSNLGNSRTGQC